MVHRSVIIKRRKGRVVRLVRNCKEGRWMGDSKETLMRR